MRQSRGEQRDVALMRPAEQEADMVLDGEAGKGISADVGCTLGD